MTAKKLFLFCFFDLNLLVLFYLFFLFLHFLLVHFLVQFLTKPIAGQRREKKQQVVTAGLFSWAVVFCFLDGKRAALFFYFFFESTLTEI